MFRDSGSGRSQARHPLAAMVLSLCLHAVALAAITLSPATTALPDSSPPSREPLVVLVAAPGAIAADAPVDVELPADHAGIPPDRNRPSPLAMAGFTFDLERIRARRISLFPFLTVDLMFLDGLSGHVRARSEAAPGLRASGVERASRPPLAMSDSQLQQVIDDAWTRRRRWRRFGTIAELLQDHDPDEGRAASLVRAYLDQNLLQPFCAYAVGGVPGRPETIRDPMLWAVLENVSEHLEFIDFVRAFAREHPSSKTTTELLFLLDELLQASRDGLRVLMETDPSRHLSSTAAMSPDAPGLVADLQSHYRGWLARRQLSSTERVNDRYDRLRLRLLRTIIDTTPAQYREADARFLAGTVLFRRGRTDEAREVWADIVPDARDSYVSAYMALKAELGMRSELDTARIQRALDRLHAESWNRSYDRLRQFGKACDTY
jgi:hypothetical protein